MFDIIADHCSSTDREQFKLKSKIKIYIRKHITQGYNAKKVKCSCVYSAYMLKPVPLCGICKQEKMHQCSFSIRFDNSHNSFLWPEYFIDFFMWKMDSMSGFDIRLVFTLPPRDSTLQYKRCVHLWNNFPCIITLDISLVRIKCFIY